jgi:hypothetical protein
VLFSSGLDWGKMNRLANTNPPALFFCAEKIFHFIRIGHLVFRTFEKKVRNSCEVKRLNAKMETHEN